jgi:hypothetical protein
MFGFKNMAFQKLPLLLQWDKYVKPTLLGLLDGANLCDQTDSV